MARKGKKGVTLYIPERLYQRIIEMCEKRHMQVTPYIIMAIVEWLKKEQEWDGEKYL